MSDKVFDLNGDSFLEEKLTEKKDMTIFEKSILSESLIAVGSDKVLPITFKKGGKLDTIDFIENTSGVLVGASGTGKTYFLKNVIKQWSMATTPDELKLIIFGGKSKFEFRDVNKLPHVLGVMDDVEKFLDVVDAVYDEIECRKEIFKNDDLKCNSIKQYNSLYKENKIPNIVLIIDDITSLLGVLKEQEDNGENDTYKKVKLVLSKISQEGRSLGVRLLIASHRSIDTSIPKNVMANSSFKLAFNLNTKSDYNALGFDEVIKKELVDKGALVMENKKGEAILKVMDRSGPINIQVLEDETNNDLTELVEYWNSKDNLKDKLNNIYSDKLKNMFK